MENEIGMNMMKKILLVVVALLGLVSLQVNAQEGVTRTLYMDKAVKGTLPLTAKHGGDIENCPMWRRCPVLIKWH